MGRIAGWIGLVMVLVGQAQGQELVVPDPDNIESAYRKPYTKVDPVGAPVISPERVGKTVMFFFSADCPVSRSVHQTIVDWGRTLPAGWRVAQVPYASGSDLAPAAVAYAARLHARDTGQAFHEAGYWRAAYSLAQDGHARLDRPDPMLEALRRAGYREVDGVRRTLGDPRVEESVLRAHQAFARYGIDRVPALVIGGKYLVHADHVGNNPVEMLRIANGLISQIIESER